MAETDYQLALLLQHRFEREAKKPKEHKSDIELARALQEQFRTEAEIDVPKNGLVYKVNKGSHNSSKCLVDPSWEVIDPTPDIHVLFMSFNDRFFWSALLAVCVSWSKRMMSCAGVCSYQGKGGLCSITLSEPLLKLRPRKDLVETLLHEMIHAYLFVTDNNRDRDGHGPEFHKHMYRINKEAGTNITVYHDFHDEVRLYQKHWWRCNGPCQKRKPYFGTVQRAINRAPGPNDKWWAEHSRTCGGTFIKVQEPEKPSKKRPAKENVKPKEDIRKYISPIKADAAAKGSVKTITSTAVMLSSTRIDRESPVTIIHTIKNSADNGKKINTVIPKSNNIYGFDIIGGNISGIKRKGTGTAVKNSSSTVVVNKKPSTTKTNVATTSTAVQTTRLEDIENNRRPIAVYKKPRTTTKTNVATASIAVQTTQLGESVDYSAVRNHWLNRFPAGTPSGVKRVAPVTSQYTANKTPRVMYSKLSKVKEDETTADCPVCLEPVPLNEFNEHLDHCLQEPKKKKCIICDRNIPAAEYELHVWKCSEESLDNPQTTSNADLKSKKCTICEKALPVEEFESHVEKCLLKFYDNMEDTYSVKGEHVDCLICGQKVLRSELDAHLDDCMGLSRVFEDDTAPLEGESADSCDEDKFNCPFCMMLVSEEEMSLHIDSCLNTSSTSAEGEINKEIFIESLQDEDF